MGVGGHILGPKKLRKLSNLTGLSLDRAAIRNGASEGIVWHEDGTDTHYEIDPKTGEHEPIEDPMHWSTCRTRSIPDKVRQ